MACLDFGDKLVLSLYQKWSQRSQTSSKYFSDILPLRSSKTNELPWKPKSWDIIALTRVIRMAQQSFLFLTFSSANMHSVSSGTLYSVSILEGILSLTYRRVSPRFEKRPNLHGLEKPLIKNWVVGKSLIKRNRWFLDKNVFCDKINDKNCFQDFLRDSKWNEISTLHKIDSAYITLHWERNEIKFCFGGSSREKTNATKANHFYFNEINACADDILCYLITWYCIKKI